MLLIPYRSEQANISIGVWFITGVSVYTIITTETLQSALWLCLSWLIKYSCVLGQLCSLLSWFFSSQILVLFSVGKPLLKEVQVYVLEQI
jgi:hypothetical protein